MPWAANRRWSAGRRSRPWRRRSWVRGATRSVSSQREDLSSPSRGRGSRLPWALLIGDPSRLDHRQMHQQLSPAHRAGTRPPESSRASTTSDPHTSRGWPPVLEVAGARQQLQPEGATYGCALRGSELSHDDARARGTDESRRLVSAPGRSARRSGLRRIRSNETPGPSATHSTGPAVVITRVRLRWPGHLCRLLRLDVGTCSCPIRRPDGHRRLPRLQGQLRGRRGGSGRIEVARSI